MIRWSPPRHACRATAGSFSTSGRRRLIAATGFIANRGYVFSPEGKRVLSYDKIHMFDVDLDNGESWRESAVYCPGSEVKTASLPFAGLGFAICYDVRFPELFRMQAAAGVELMSLPAAFTRQTGEAHWHVLLRARAIENGLFVIAAAQGGRHEDGRETFGHSLIIDPWGRILAEAGPEGEAVIVANIDIAEVAAARARIPQPQECPGPCPCATSDRGERWHPVGWRRGRLIRYALSCPHAHGFEGWFSSSEDFERQQSSGLVTCPVCNSAEIGKVLMAPSVATSRKKEETRTLVLEAAQQEAVRKLRQTVAEIRANADDVGERFAEEARRIHYAKAKCAGSSARRRWMMRRR